MLPGEFLGSRNCKEYVEMCIRNDFLHTLKNIRQGKRYVAPCASIYSVLSSFGKLSEAHLPFGFYRSYRTVGVVSQRQLDEPIASIKLKGPKAMKELFLVRSLLCIKLLVQIPKICTCEKGPEAIYSCKYFRCILVGKND